MSETVPVTELLDLASLRVDGPCILFVRPRRPLSREEQSNIGNSDHAIHRSNPDVFILHVPHDIDLMAIGEADLEKIGLARIPKAPTSEQGDL